MNRQDVERFFFDTPAPGLESVAARGPSTKEFRPPPVRADRRPFRLDLAAVLPADSC
jgi:hypothetical protein